MVVVFLTYQLAQRLFDDKVALLSALLVMGAEILAKALVEEGKWAITIPAFGFERRGVGAEWP